MGYAGQAQDHSSGLCLYALCRLSVGSGFNGVYDVEPGRAGASVAGVVNLTAGVEYKGLAVVGAT